MRSFTSGEKSWGKGDGGGGGEFYIRREEVGRGTWRRFMTRIIFVIAGGWIYMGGFLTEQFNVGFTVF